MTTISVNINNNGTITMFNRSDKNKLLSKVWDDKSILAIRNRIRVIVPMSAKEAATETVEITTVVVVVVTVVIISSPANPAVSPMENTHDSSYVTPYIYNFVFSKQKK
jgi:hypothetical protein